MWSNSQQVMEAQLIRLKLLQVRWQAIEANVLQLNEVAD
jgi:hypothetical protein